MLVNEVPMHSITHRWTLILTLWISDGGVNRSVMEVMAVCVRVRVSSPVRCMIVMSRRSSKEFVRRCEWKKTKMQRGRVGEDGETKAPRSRGFRRWRDRASSNKSERRGLKTLRVSIGGAAAGAVSAVSPFHRHLFYCHLLLILLLHIF